MSITINGKQQRSFSAYQTDSKPVDNPYALLAAAIVIHAAEDWRMLISERAWEEKTVSKHRNFTELRLFFNGRWCAFLMQDFSVEPADILAQLEQELAAAQLQPKTNKRRSIKFRA